MQRDDELWELLISLALGSAELTGAQRCGARPLPSGPRLGLCGSARSVQPGPRNPALPEGVLPLAGGRAALTPAPRRRGHGRNQRVGLDLGG